MRDLSTAHSPKRYNVDTGVQEVVDTKDRAIKRVNMILDNRERAEQLTELLVDEVARKTKQVVDSPAVNKMFDKFMG